MIMKTGMKHTMIGKSILTVSFAAFDPHSRQPSYKACAVNVSAA